MFDFGPRPRLPLARLFETLAQSFRLGRGEHVVGVDNPLGLHEHAILLLSERHQIPLPDVEGFEHLPWNDYLAPLAYSPYPLLDCG
jgi:hypothetical protein